MPITLAAQTNIITLKQIELIALAMVTAAILAHLMRMHIKHTLYAFAESIFAIQKGNWKVFHYEFFHERGCLPPLVVALAILLAALAR